MGAADSFIRGLSNPTSNDYHIVSSARRTASGAGAASPQPAVPCRAERSPITRTNDDASSPRRKQRHPRTPHGPRPPRASLRPWMGFLCRNSPSRVRVPGHVLVSVLTCTGWGLLISGRSLRAPLSDSQQLQTFHFLEIFYFRNFLFLVYDNLCI